MIEIRHRTDSERLRKNLENKFNIGLDGLEIVEKHLHMHSLDEDGNGFEYIDEENPQAKSLGEYN